MKKASSFLKGQNGFSLIEIAIVMVIIGLLAGGGVSLMGMLTARKARSDTQQYLVMAKNALVTFAVVNGRLPWADTDDDGQANTHAAVGTLPYGELQISPADAYKRVLKYALNSSLGVDRAVSCSALRSGLSASPLVVDADGAAPAFAAAAVLISAGPMDADSSGNVFDAIAVGAHRGDNTDGAPNYLRHPPADGFDDLTTYLGGTELFAAACGQVARLTVSNRSAAAVYVYDLTRATDAGMLAAGATAAFEMVPGSRVRLGSAAAGAGSVVGSAPASPLTLADDQLVIVP
jgi:prepilin-type N-terminal cleavage/methylation domain-containing protein